MNKLQRAMGVAFLILALGMTITAQAAAKKHTGKRQGSKQTAAARTTPAHKGSVATRTTTRTASKAHATSAKSTSTKKSKTSFRKGSAADGKAVRCPKRSKHCRVTAGRRSDASARMTPSQNEVAESEAGTEIVNTSALEPFFAQLAAHEANPAEGLVRILHFGDSHTAADMFTGEMRARLQEKFGDGGVGFSAAGYPFLGYRIHGTRRSESTGWTTEGTHLSAMARGESDGLLGLGGISVSTSEASESVTLDAEADTAELFYLQQPGGGRVEILESETTALLDASAAPLATFSTDGETGAGAFTIPLTAKITPERHLEVRTLDAAPVRLFGIVAEKSSGVTYEAMGINGAEMSLMLKWNEDIQSSYLARRSPALVVLDYGTNEAANHTWEYDNYKQMLAEVIGRIRKAVPGVSILVLGPTDRDLKARRRWSNFAGTERITRAQHDACVELGCAFWDQQAAMGGWGSMSKWVRSGLAQGDHTHLTSPGYIKLADALSAELLHQYEKYRKGAAK